MKKKIPKERKIKREKKSLSLLPILFIILFLGLFSETVRILPAGALSEKFADMPYELPKLNSHLIEEKLLKKDDYQRIKEELIFERVSNKQRKMHGKIKKIKKIENIEKDIKNIQTQIEKVQTEIIEIES